jgi:hypothetical protein
MVKNSSFWIMFVLIPELNPFTCFHIYLRNAALDQRQSSIIANTGTPAKNIAMVAPLQAEWRPIWMAENPKVSFPNVAATNHGRFSSSCLEKWCGVAST